MVEVIKLIRGLETASAGVEKGLVLEAQCEVL